MARPRIEIDYKTLDGLCKLQCTGDECANVLGIDYDTLDRALKREKKGGFAEYFKKTSAGGKASLRRMQWKAAEGGNSTMQIWLGKQYLEQSDKHVDKTDDIPAPVRIIVTVEDASKLSPQD